MNALTLMTVYGFLADCGAGVLAVTGLVGLLRAPNKVKLILAIIAAICMVCGVVTLSCAIGGVTRTFTIATNAVHGSPKSLEFVFAILGFIVAVAYAIALVRSEDTRVHKAFEVIAILVGVALAATSGVVASIGHITWTSIVLPAAYLCNALAIGVAVFLCIYALVGKQAADAQESAEDDELAVAPNSKLLKIMILIAFVILVLQAISLVVLVALAEFIGDQVLFWLGCMVVGTLVPVVCTYVYQKQRLVAFVSLICLVIGGYCLRIYASSLGAAGLSLIASAIARSGGAG
ncbi:MAG: polysulfide reductase NrfD [Coriobacteriales bacterium]|nr:polysulfide reductase NrfD [Coriobacteriales bacterium]